MSIVLIISIAVAVVSVIVCVYLKLTRTRCTCKADLTGKTVIVTGANSGIGYFTALDFATRNARVILACRNMDKATEACSKIKEETGNKNIIAKHLELSSLKSVRKFADEIKKEEKRLHILVNNAGVLGLPQIMTDEGLEYMYATNHFGPFLLTNLLLDLLKASAPSRIVNVSSVVNKMGRIDFGNLRAERAFNRQAIYFNSKLANILFTKELARILKGTGVSANCLHPGSVNSGLLRNLPAVVREPLRLLAHFYFMTAEEGAQTTIHCAVSEKVEGISGIYFMGCKEADSSANRVSQDEGVARKLWEISETYTGLTQ
ncbi:retinol dehydrogenase 14-like [Gigantopelta aegis]|uniref:retinol dehydrogenase 14-like n=1 Tax=Gigantopelta aegis TaxID=1735272 RepID=UPI001B8880C6|nr:retinol dehydrogenase 14-like [Gigantopelta aegis]XP_041368616.1 retinol dehydrogenase 14-like [Gigantopelta aegis]